MLGNFGVFSFLRSWKLTRFLTTCVSATYSKFGLLALFCISLKRLERFFFKISPRNLHNVNNNVWNFHRDWFTATPWNFKTNLSYEPVKHLPYNSHRFDVMLTFPKQCALYIRPLLVHFSLNLSKLTILTLKCTCQGYMYSPH